MNRLNPRLAAAALASVSALALSASAQAQVYNWSGFYIGANAGAAWSGADATSSVPCPAATFGPGYFCLATSPANGAAVSASGTGSLSNTGFTGGVQAGRLWQNNSLVYGLEADFGAFKLNASRQASANYPASTWVSSTNVYTIKSSVDTDWLFTARGRVGWAFSNVLAYATGGLAVTSIDVSNSFQDNFANGGVPGASGNWNGSGTKIGWTLGGGLEWALNRYWTVKAEYLYLDFGSVSASGRITHPGFGGYSEAISTSTDVTAHIARGGINFKF